MTPIAEVAGDVSWVFLELGAATVGMSLLARLANRFGISTIPLYLLGGLAFGNGGLVPLRFSEGIIHIGGEIGVLLLLFMLGLEYTGEELAGNLRAGFGSGVLDFLLNFTPGLLAGQVMGWGLLASLILGGVTYISSSGIVAKVLAELNWQENPETPVVLSILVLEDMAMAVFLPLVAVLLTGQGWVAGVTSVLVAMATVGVILALAARYGRAISRRLSGESDEVVLLTTLGLVLVVAGVAQRLQVSAAVGAFLVGIALSGPIAERAHRMIAPLRDLSAAVFFLFFGLEINPATLPPVLLPAVILGVVTGLTKFATGWWAARSAGVDAAGRRRAGAALLARGEFSIVIAGLGVGAGLEPRLGPLSAAYVLLLAILGPTLALAVRRTAATATEGQTA